jgi:hypothetical protein
MSQDLALASVHEDEFLPSYPLEPSGATAVEEAITHFGSLHC